MTQVSLSLRYRALAGLMLHRELELEVKAGIPAPKALQIATGMQRNC